MSLGLVDLVGVEDFRSEMIRELGLTLGTESWLRLGINWIWDCGGGGGGGGAAPLGLW